MASRPPPDAIEKRERCLRALREFKSAAFALLDYWDDPTMDRRGGARFYPFNQSFEDIWRQIGDWSEYVHEAQYGTPRRSNNEQSTKPPASYTGCGADCTCTWNKDEEPPAPRIPARRIDFDA